MAVTVMRNSLCKPRDTAGKIFYCRLVLIGIVWIGAAIVHIIIWIHIVAVLVYGVTVVVILQRNVLSGISLRVYKIIADIQNGIGSCDEGRYGYCGEEENQNSGYNSQKKI